jgi:hypothetical protein
MTPCQKHAPSMETMRGDQSTNALGAFRVLKRGHTAYLCHAFSNLLHAATAKKRVAMICRNGPKSGESGRRRRCKEWNDWRLN